MAVCSKRAVWISVFLAVLVLGFTAHLLGVLTPSWQYVYLEDGRTVHHHGLWLDCKRDYSNEYGRPRSYYETIYKLNDLQSPFDQFFLPKLQCVYKFDYWLDDEDWYEHGYDENRLQGDAYQHLWVGWKIAAFAAHTFGLIAAAVSIVLLICGFCHRLLLCVAAVLVTLAAIGCTAGNVTFFMFARYQDNNIIREEDGVYEQYFGWSFVAAVVGNALLVAACTIGCCATSAVLAARKTRLVKVEVDSTSDQARLIQLKSMNPNETLTTGSGFDVLAGGDPSQLPSFKRSYSAVYKIDSAALRKWEKAALKQQARRQADAFKRTNSMPNFKKHSFPRIASCSTLQESLATDDSLKAFTEPLAQTTRQFVPLAAGRRLHPSASMETSGEGGEVIYEYVDQHSFAPQTTPSSTLMARHRTDAASGAGGQHFYDWVPSEGSRTQLVEPSLAAMGENDYLKPKPATSIGVHGGSTPQLATRPGRTLLERIEREQIDKRVTTTSFGVGTKEPSPPSTRFSATPDADIHKRLFAPKVPPKPLPPSTPIPTAPPTAAPKKTIQLNLFQPPAPSSSGNGSLRNGCQRQGAASRSITDLPAVSATDQAPVSVFDRRESTLSSSSTPPPSHLDADLPVAPSPLASLNWFTSSRAGRRAGGRGTAPPSSISTTSTLLSPINPPLMPTPPAMFKETNFDSSPLDEDALSSMTNYGYAPSEMDRSVGSVSTTFIATTTPPSLLGGIALTTFQPPPSTPSAGSVCIARGNGRSVV